MGYLMDDPPKLLFGTLEYENRCGAKTRNGGRCQNAPRQLGGRCRMHGGNSLRGPEHPRYKTGKYSKYKPVEPMDLAALLAWCADLPPLDFSWLDATPNPLDGLELIDISELLS